MGKWVQTILPLRPKKMSTESFASIAYHACRLLVQLPSYKLFSLLIRMYKTTSWKHSSKSRDMDIKTSAHFILFSFCFLSACVEHALIFLLLYSSLSLQITQTDGEFISSIAEVQLKELPFPVALFLSSKSLSLF